MLTAPTVKPRSASAAAAPGCVLPASAGIPRSTYVRALTLPKASICASEKLRVSVESNGPTDACVCEVG